MNKTSPPDALRTAADTVGRLVGHLGEVLTLVPLSDEPDFDLHKPGRPASAVMERHNRPDELSEAWGLSAKVIREIFSSEPGVLRIDRPERRHKRGYCTLRIPESVAISVHNRLTRRD